MAEQLTFYLPGEPALGRSDFFISPSNAAAVDAVQSWHDWPQGKLVLVGPSGSGKTHLAHVWAALTGAEIFAAADLARADFAGMQANAVVVEDADGIAGQPDAEQALFHLHNLAQQSGRALLITAATPPMRWGLVLADLASRMQGSAIATLGAPDEALLAAVLVKLFADRQLTVGPNVIGWLTLHMERSFEMAGRVVDELDRAALAQRRAVTQPLAASVLDKLGQGRA